MTNEVYVSEKLFVIIPRYQDRKWYWGKNYEVQKWTKDDLHFSCKETRFLSEEDYLFFKLAKETVVQYDVLVGNYEK